MMFSTAHVIAALVAGFGLKAMIDVALEYLTTRPRIATTASNYFQPCTGCTISRTSEIGMRIRTVVARTYNNVRRARR
jgi:ethanolamine ammonia-lyase large subunit